MKKRIVLTLSIIIGMAITLIPCLQVVRDAGGEGVAVTPSLARHRPHERPGEGVKLGRALARVLESLDLYEKALELNGAKRDEGIVPGLKRLGELTVDDGTGAAELALLGRRCFERMVGAQRRAERTYGTGERRRLHTGCSGPVAVDGVTQRHGIGQRNGQSCRSRSPGKQEHPEDERRTEREQYEPTRISPGQIGEIRCERFPLGMGPSGLRPR